MSDVPNVAGILQSWEQEYLEERAAIREHDGGATEEQAMRGAMEDLERYKLRTSEGNRNA